MVVDDSATGDESATVDDSSIVDKSNTSDDCHKSNTAATDDSATVVQGSLQMRQQCDTEQSTEHHLVSTDDKILRFGLNQRTCV